MMYCNDIENGKWLIQYIRKSKKDRSKKGIFISFADGNNVLIGYALCNKKDRWDYLNGQRIYKLGQVIAMERAYKYADKNDINVPISIADEFNDFVIRTKRYFKDKNLPKWAV